MMYIGWGFKALISMQPAFEPAPCKLRSFGPNFLGSCLCDGGFHPFHVARKRPSSLGVLPQIRCSAFFPKFVGLSQANGRRPPPGPTSSPTSPRDPDWRSERLESPRRVCPSSLSSNRGSEKGDPKSK